MDKISDLKVNELRELIRMEVEQTVLELFGDPDDGLELQKEIKTRLERSLANKQAVKKNISAQKVAEKLGLEW